jgi:hypothetical protein
MSVCDMLFGQRHGGRGDNGGASIRGETRERRLEEIHGLQARGEYVIMTTERES